MADPIDLGLDAAEDWIERHAMRVGLITLTGELTAPGYRRQPMAAHMVFQATEAWAEVCSVGVWEPGATGDPLTSIPLACPLRIQAGATLQLKISFDETCWPVNRQAVAADLRRLRRELA